MLRRLGWLALLLAVPARGGDEDPLGRIRRLLKTVKDAPEEVVEPAPPQTTDDLSLRLEAEHQVQRLIAPGKPLELVMNRPVRTERSVRYTGTATHWDGNEIEWGNWAIEFRRDADKWVCASRHFEVTGTAESPRALVIELGAVDRDHDRARVTVTGRELGTWQRGAVGLVVLQLRARVETTLDAWIRLGIARAKVPVEFRYAPGIDQRLLREIVRALSQHGITGITLTTRP